MEFIKKGEEVIVMARAASNEDDLLAREGGEHAVRASYVVSKIEAHLI